MCTLTLLIATSPVATLAAEIDHRSAAEIDWQPASEVSAEDKEKLPYFCQGQYKEQPIKSAPNPVTINATADNAVYVDGISLTLTGDVVLTQGSQQVNSPRIIQNELTQITEIDGPLQIRDSGLLLTGEHATQNLFEGTGIVDKATFLFHQSNMRGEAAQFTRNNEGFVFLDDATLTRCDPGSNVWEMNSKDIQLNTAEGFGTARDVTIRIKDVPVIYLPYFRFPINDQRLSGFLLPSVGYDSDGGTDINIPYYFNLAPNYDATYQLHSLWKRGFVHNGQFRFMSRRTLNEINVGFLRKDDIYDDREVIDQTSTGTDTSLIETPAFKKQDRWLLNLRHEAGWDSRWKTSLDYSAVSDVDYLHDIGGDVNSSAVEQYIDPVASNYTNRRSASLNRLGQLQYRGEIWNVELAVQGFQTLDRNGAPQYEKLPNLNADWRSTLGPLDVNLDLDYTFFEKRNTSDVIGERVIIDIETSWPFRSIWGYIEPAIGVTHRKYVLDDTAPGARANPEITTPRFVLDSGLYFDRFFTWNKSSILQTLEPRFYFLYVQNDEQDDLPTFDASAPTDSYSSLFRDNRFSGGDRIGDARQISLGITSRFLSEESGAEFFSIGIGQIYYLKDREVIFQAKPADDPTARESALFTQARLSFENGLSASGTFEWEPDKNRTNRGTFSLKYSDEIRRIVNLTYIYTSPEIQPASLTSASEESDLSFVWPLYLPLKGKESNFSLIGRWNFNWDDNRTIESFFGLEYNDCCWKSRLVIRRFLKEPRNVTNIVDDPDNPGQFIEVTDFKTPSDVGIFFEFQLKGLATLGKRLDSLLEDAIPGYRNREDQIGL